MHQRNRLEGVAGNFVGHADSRQPAQLLVNRRQQFFRCLLFAAVNGLQDQSNVAHELIKLCKNATNVGRAK